MDAAQEQSIVCLDFLKAVPYRGLSLYVTDPSPFLQFMDLRKFEFHITWNLKTVHAWYFTVLSKMLYVFHVDTGTMMTFDMGLLAGR